MGPGGPTPSLPTGLWTTTSPIFGRRSSRTPPTRATCAICAASDTGLMAEMLRKPDHSGRAFMHWSIILFGWAVMVRLIGAGVAAVLLARPDACRPIRSVQLEAAFHREIVLGDLKGALEQYKLDPGQPRQIAEPWPRGRCGRRRSAWRNWAGGGSARHLHARGEAIRRPSGDRRAGPRATGGWENPLAGPRNLKFEQGSAGQTAGRLVCAGASERCGPLGGAAPQRLPEPLGVARWCGCRPMRPFAWPI